jgi:hypothetical protein
VVAPHDGMLMDAGHVEQVDWSAEPQAVGAQPDHMLFGDRLTDLLLVFQDFLPIRCSDPKRVSANPHSFKAFFQGFIELLMPPSHNPLEIKLTAPEVPLGA